MSQRKEQLRTKRHVVRAGYKPEPGLPSVIVVSTFMGK